jgi:D-glycero-alpha-D-manno-heptose 1-phosphate guanylyltransferase
MEAIILAGGKGTRLASRLNNIPKPMAMVAGRPFLEWLLDALVVQGFQRCILSVGHLHQVIQDYFGNFFAGMQLEYVLEEGALGTGGAIRRTLSSAQEDSVFVLNGDTFARLDFQKMFQQHLHSGLSLSMAVVYQENAERYGRVLLDGEHVTGFREKGIVGPGWINAGVYILNKALAWPDGLAPQFSFESDFLAPHITELRPKYYTCDEYFIDIGIPEDLDRAQSEFGRGQIF